jgi:hypothetical protein
MRYEAFIDSTGAKVVAKSEILTELRLRRDRLVTELGRVQHVSNPNHGVIQRLNDGLGAVENEIRKLERVQK